MKGFGGRIGVVALTLVLASWGTSQQALTLTGQIENRTGERGSVAAYLGYFDSRAMGGSIAYGTAAEDGTFSLELPAIVPSDTLQEAERASLCLDGAADLTVVPEPFPHAIVVLLMAFLDSDTPSVALLASSVDAVEQMTAEPSAVADGDFGVYFLYVPMEVSIKGRCRGEDDIPMSYNIQAIAGWNYLRVGYEEIDGVVTGNLSASSDMPPGATWFSITDQP
jgi:hypothetical protein